MADIFSAFGNYTSFFGTLFQWAGYIIIALAISGLIFAMILMILLNARKKQVIELHAVTRRCEFLVAAMRKNPHGRNQFYISKIKKYIPNIQQDDMFIKGRKDVLFLYKDNNGLHHTLRLPTHEEVQKWYKVVYGVDINDIKKKIDAKEKLTPAEYRVMEIIGTVYLMPNPSEDLEWLAEQQTQATTVFGTEWWKNPVVMTIVWVFCIGLFTITWFILASKVFK